MHGFDVIASTIFLGVYVGIITLGIIITIWWGGKK